MYSQGTCYCQHWECKLLSADVGFRILLEAPATQPRKGSLLFVPTAAVVLVIVEVYRVCCIPFNILLHLCRAPVRSVPSLPPFHSMGMRFRKGWSCWVSASRSISNRPENWTWVCLTALRLKSPNLSSLMCCVALGFFFSQYLPNEDDNSTYLIGLLISVIEGMCVRCSCSEQHAQQWSKKPLPRYCRGG